LREDFDVGLNRYDTKIWTDFVIVLASAQRRDRSDERRIFN
jgi:hypothetical protein